MKRYIRSSQTVTSYTVYYIDRDTDRQMSRVVEADDPEEAAKAAKAELGKRMYRLIRVEAN